MASGKLGTLPIIAAFKPTSGINVWHLPVVFSIPITSVIHTQYAFTGKRCP